MTDEQEYQEKVVKRLNVLINLLLDMKLEATREKTMRAKLQELSDMGLSPSEIADIVGWAPKSVSGELSKMKKAKKGGKLR